LSSEKAQALVLRTADWSETSRIATLWTKEFGKVRVLAKGGRRLKSNFETALDLLTVCSIVFLRKSSGSLDLLTEARVVQRFPLLTTNLHALYAGYYIAELLADWTEDYDPHPRLFDDALETLADLGKSDVPTGPRLAKFELALLTELGYSPVFDHCAGCGLLELEPDKLAFSSAAGGMVCPACRPRQRACRSLSAAAWHALQALAGPGEGWRRDWDKKVRAEIRQLLNQHVTYLMGRRPRLLSYLGS
jgi:DNA repair protein RecO (recombination protein O)